MPPACVGPVRPDRPAEVVGARGAWRRRRLSDEGPGRARRAGGRAAADRLARAASSATRCARDRCRGADCGAGRAAVVCRDVARARQRVFPELLRRRQPRALHDRALQRRAAVLVLSSGPARRADAVVGVPRRLQRRRAGPHPAANASSRRRRLATPLWAVMPLLFFTRLDWQTASLHPARPPAARRLRRARHHRTNRPSTRPPALGRDVDHGRHAMPCSRSCSCAWSRSSINAYPLATWIGVCLLGCSAIALGRHRGDLVVATPASWRRHRRSARPRLGVVRRAGRQSARSRRADGRADSRQPLRRRADRRPRCVHAESRLLHRLAATCSSIDVEQASTFLQSPQRVLLVLRSADVPAVAAASGLAPTTLGETRYLNTANIRLRTLLRPDPTDEIELVSLVTNR